ncbi:MAG: hypothetical protein QOH93_2466 [Chloroflexia bacterium]|jgi:tetratricopeptide (TPR) repeat protein|nr:hypothetical protein [Chloroflexia bacterium]
MSIKKKKGQQIQQATFVGRQDYFELFRSLLPLNRSTQVDILVIYGIAGIGKTELLKRFQQLAEEAGVPVAKIEPPTQKSIFNFVLSIHQQLSGRIRFPNFEEGLRRHQQIESRLLDSDTPKTAIKLFAKGAHTLLKLVPGANLLTEAVSSEQMEAAVSHIYRAVGRTEGDFWMKPEDELTNRLVTDLNAYCAQNRLVLMIDHYEAIGDFDSWVRDELFANLEEYGIVVIAGWHRLEGKAWREHVNLMRQIELTPLSIEEAREYLRKSGLKDEQIIEEVVAYAGGHPLALSMVAELAEHVQLKVGDLEHIPERHNIVRELIDRITKNVAQNLRAALESCAILRLVTEGAIAWMLELSKEDAQKTFEELSRFGFVKVRGDDLGIALHDAVWSAMNDEQRWRNPERFCALNLRAANYFEVRLNKVVGQKAERYALERLYHNIQADEGQGMTVFQNMAEGLARYRLLDGLRTTLNDVYSYRNCLILENSRLWLEYYRARLAQLEGRLGDAETVYESLSREENIDSKLQAYALCDLGVILRAYEQHERAATILQRSLSTVPVDAKLASGLVERSGALWRIGELDEANEVLDKAKDFYVDTGDKYGLVYTLNRAKGRYLSRGLFHEAVDFHTLAWKESTTLSPQSPFLRMELLGGWGIAWTWTGKLHECEKDLKRAIEIAEELQLPEQMYYYPDLAYVLGLQEKYSEAESYFAKAFDFLAARLSGRHLAARMSVTKGLRGAILLRSGHLDEASTELAEGLIGKREIGDFLGIAEVCNWLGELNEIRSMTAGTSSAYLMGAESYYQESVDMQWVGRLYFDSDALAGLVRVKFEQKDYPELMQLYAEADNLAQEHEYNNHLAILRLVRGHLAWDGYIAGWDGGFNAALDYYKQGLIHALRFNRFLLDEIMSGRQQGTMLRSIIPHCQNHGEEGRRMLMTLREWWHDGTNDVGTARTNTISPVPEGIPLIEAERMARDREPGDESPQKFLEDHFKDVLN